MSVEDAATWVERLTAEQVQLLMGSAARFDFAAHPSRRHGQGERLADRCLSRDLHSASPTRGTGTIPAADLATVSDTRVVSATTRLVTVEAPTDPL